MAQFMRDRKQYDINGDPIVYDTTPLSEEEIEEEALEAARVEHEVDRIDSYSVERARAQKRQAAEDLRQGVAIGDGLSGLDRRLLEYAKNQLSANEMEAELGGIMTGAQAVQRIKEILRAKNVFSFLEVLTLSLLDMSDLKDHVQSIVMGEHVDSNGRRVFGNVKWADLLRKVIGDQNKMLREMQDAIKTIERNITAEDAGLMIEAIDRSFQIFTRKIIELYPDVQMDVLVSLMEESIPPAITYVEQKARGK